MPELGSVTDRLLAAFPAVDGPHSDVATYRLWREPVEGRRYVLSLNGQEVQRVALPGSMLDWVLMDLTRTAVAREERFIAIHAGVVSSDSRAVLLPAAPSSGKTTTVAGLVRAGMSYLSDEVAFVDRERVHPFPRPLVMDPASVEAVAGLAEDLPPVYAAFRDRWFHVSPDDLRAGAVGGPASLAVIVSPRYVAGAGTTLRPLSRAEGLMALAEHAFDLRGSPENTMSDLRALCERIPGYELQIGDLGEAVEIVTALLR